MDIASSGDDGGLRQSFFYGSSFPSSSAGTAVPVLSMPIGSRMQYEALFIKKSSVTLYRISSTVDWVPPRRNRRAGPVIVKSGTASTGSEIRALVACANFEKNRRRRR